MYYNFIDFVLLFVFNETFFIYLLFYTPLKTRI